MSTYLSSKALIKSLLKNSTFVTLSQQLVGFARGSADYTTTFNAITTLLTSLDVDPTIYRVNIIKSDGGYWYANNQSITTVATVENHNSRPEISSAVNYAWGNPIINRKLYPSNLRDTVCEGYGLAARVSSTTNVSDQYVAKTYKDGKSPLGDRIFTLRVAQSV